MLRDFPILKTITINPLKLYCAYDHMKKNKIVVVGLGYVDLSNSILLELNNTLTEVDINIDKVNLLNKKLTSLGDKI